MSGHALAQSSSVFPLARDETRALALSKHADGGETKAFALILNPNGTVLEIKGQNSSPYHYGRPERIAGISSIVAVAAGGSHRMALRADGTVWVWGTNTEGQLGTGDYVSRNSPVEIIAIENAIAISAGDKHSVVLTQDGEVWAWGSNFSGQISIVDTDPDPSAFYFNYPRNIASGIKAISAGWHHTLLIGNDGTVWACGNEETIQANPDGSATLRTLPTGWGDLRKVMIDSDTSLRNASDIGAGADHSIALIANAAGVKEAWTWGFNKYGQLGDPFLPQRVASGSSDFNNRPTPTMVSSNVSKIAAGAFHCAVQKTDGSIWVWGDSEGITKCTDQYVNGSNLPLQVQGVADPVTLVAGYNQTWAAFPSPGPVGDIRKMGNTDPALNPSMQFGSIAIPLGDYESPQLRKIAGSSLIGTTLVTPRDRSIWAVGKSRYAETPAQFGSESIGKTVASVSQGNKRGTSATMWELALVHGDTGSIPFGKVQKWKMGYKYNTDTYDTIAPTFIIGLDQVAAIDSATHSLAFLALKGDGTVWMLDSEYNPTQTAGWYGAGFTPLNITALNNLSIGERVVQISAGLEHFAALTNKGNVYTWGQNTAGQIGNGTISATSASITPTKASVSDVASVYCGKQSTHVIKRDGSVWAWGRGALGGTAGGAAMSSNFTTPLPVEITNLSKQVVSFAISSGMSSPHYLAITRNGKVLAWGANNYGQLGIGSQVEQLAPYEIPGLSNVVEVAAGNQTSFFRVGTNSQILACGLNSRADLGDGTLVNRSTPTVTLFPFNFNN